jgi:muconolactone delta-isomerase
MEYLVTMTTLVPDGTTEVLASMPLRVWRSDQVVALSAHPNDPSRLPQ